MKYPAYKKTNRNQTKPYRSDYYEDEISDMGRKGGRVEKTRQQEHKIDLELRNYTYR